MEKRIIKCLMIFIIILLLVIASTYLYGTHRQLPSYEVILDGIPDFTSIVMTVDGILAVLILILIVKNIKKTNCFFWGIVYIISAITKIMSGIIFVPFRAGGLDVEYFTVSSYNWPLLIIQCSFMLITFAIRLIIILYQINIIKKENNKILKGEE